MTLLNGGFLVAGLLAATIPILIHFLFRRRRPPIDWAAMDILLEALRTQERRLKLEQWLLLAARCLLFALAGLALARPVLESASILRPNAKRTVTIVLDDGVATQARGSTTAPAFARLKEEAAQLARGLSAGDAVGVVLASRPARALVLPPTTDRDAVARAIESVDASFAATDLAAALRQAADGISKDPSGDHVVVIVSDFRQGSLDPASPPPAALVPNSGERTPRLFALSPASSELADVAITSVEAQRSIDDDSITVTVRLNRSGGGNPAGNVRVVVSADGTSPTAPKQVRFDAGQASARVEFVLRPSTDAQRLGNGAIVASIAGAGSGFGAGVGSSTGPTLGDSDALAVNDTHFAIFDARTATRIGIVARRSFGSGAEIEQVPASRWIARALMPIEQPGLEITEIEPASLDVRTIRDLDALILPRPETIPPEVWPELRRFVDRGGLLVVMPSSEANIQRWTDGFVATFGLTWQISSDAPPLESPLTFAAEQPLRGNPNGLFGAVDAELPELLRPIEVRRRLEVRNAAPGDAALVLSDNSPFLLVATPGSTDGSSPRGLVALATSAPELEWTNLPVKPFMVPFAQELVRRSLTRIGGAARAVVSDRPTVGVRDAAELSGPDGRRIPLDRSGLATAALDRPAAWSALDLAGRTVGGVAVNIDPSGTRLMPLPNDAVATWLAPAGPVSFGDATALAGQLAPAKDNVGAAVWLLIAVLVLVVIETLLARWFSHAASARGASGDPGISSSALRKEDARPEGMAA